MGTRISHVTAIENITNMAVGYDMPDVVVDGAPAARFMQRLRQMLENGVS